MLHPPVRAANEAGRPIRTQLVTPANLVRSVVVFLNPVNTGRYLPSLGGGFICPCIEFKETDKTTNIGSKTVRQVIDKQICIHIDK